MGQHPRHVPSYEHQRFEGCLKPPSPAPVPAAAPSGRNSSLLFPVHPQCSSPALHIPLLAPLIFLLNEYLISLAIGLALCWNLWAPGYPLIPFVGEQRREKNKVILGSQMKGFEAHEEKCVYLLSLVTSLSALWPSSSQASPGRFITALAPHIWSFTEFCFSKFLQPVNRHFTLSFPSQWWRLGVTGVTSSLDYSLCAARHLFPLSLRGQPTLCPRKGLAHSTSVQAGSTPYLHATYILDRAAFWSSGPRLCFVWLHVVLSSHLEIKRVLITVWTSGFFWGIGTPSSAGPVFSHGTYELYLSSQLAFTSRCPHFSQLSSQHLAS